MRDAATSWDGKGIRSVVAVGAHADDLELACFGTLALLRSRGARVRLVVMTGTPSRHHSGAVYREDAAKEAAEAARVIGCDPPEFLPYENNRVPYSTESVQAINRILDDAAPDLVLTHWPGDNQQDHQNTARAVVSAARHYPNILLFEPHPGRPTVDTHPFRPSVYVDVSDHLEAKLRAIRCHRGEYERLGGDRFFPMWEWRARLRGAEIRTTAAEAFEPLRLVLNACLDAARP